MDLKEKNALDPQAARHWYYVSKASMVAHHLPGTGYRILDVGAGIGWFSQWLLERGYGNSAMCVDPGYEQDHDAVVAGRPILFRRSAGSFNANLVLLMDVLEHVDDDVALLRQYWEMAPAGTIFVITVPAFQFLWSSHDDFLEHRRRYTVNSLRRTVELAGARPDRLHYFFGAVFPIAATIRLLQSKSKADRSDMRPVPEFINSTLTALCRAEVPLARWNRLAGLSVVARLRK